jgi:hypothetical protein
MNVEIGTEVARFLISGNTKIGSSLQCVLYHRIQVFIIASAMCLILDTAQ